MLWEMIFTSGRSRRTLRREGAREIGFQLGNRSKCCLAVDDQFVRPELESIAGSVLSPLSALRCLVWNFRTLSEIHELVGRTQEHFACRYFARILRRPGTARGISLEAWDCFNPLLLQRGTQVPCAPRCSVLSRSVSAQSLGC